MEAVGLTILDKLKGVVAVFSCNFECAATVDLCQAGRISHAGNTKGSAEDNTCRANGEKTTRFEHDTSVCALFLNDMHRETPIG
ncbi:hypothetical protein D3C76_1377690 [compost metagenome]